MKERRRIVKRSELKEKAGKQARKRKSKNNKQRVIAWQYAEDPHIDLKDGETGRNQNYRSRWPRKDRL